MLPRLLQMSVIALLAGCASLGKRPAESPVSATVETLQAAQLASYVHCAADSRAGQSGRTG